MSYVLVYVIIMNYFRKAPTRNTCYPPYPSPRSGGYGGG